MTKVESAPSSPGIAYGKIHPTNRGIAKIIDAVGVTSWLGIKAGLLFWKYGR